MVTDWRCPSASNCDLLFADGGYLSAGIGDLSFADVKHLSAGIGDLLVADREMSKCRYWWPIGC